jgi:FkbM family methyltransferase
VILSARVGHNISFQVELIDKTGANIHIFDPSPTGINTLKGLALKRTSENIVFVPKAISGISGYICVEPPDIAEEGSWKAVTEDNTESVIRIESVSVSDYCRNHEIEHIDLQKNDIEGAEYNVLDNMLSEKLSIKKICLDFYCKAQIGIQHAYFDLFWYVCQLFKNGYRIAHLTKSDFTWALNIR